MHSMLVNRVTPGSMLIALVIAHHHLRCTDQHDNSFRESYCKFKNAKMTKSNDFLERAALYLLYLQSLYELEVHIHVEHRRRPFPKGL